MPLLATMQQYSLMSMNEEGCQLGFRNYWFAIRISVPYRFSDINHQNLRTYRFREDSNPNKYKYMGFELKCYPVINI
jgi:hypothetical protein